jgi:hypothetical protein
VADSVNTFYLLKDKTSLDKKKVLVTNDWLTGHRALVILAASPAAEVFTAQFSSAVALPLGCFPPPLVALSIRRARRCCLLLACWAHHGCSVAEARSHRRLRGSTLYPRSRGGGLAFSSSSCCAAAGLGPITVAGDPPTVVSAPGRRIVASKYVDQNPSIA